MAVPALADMIGVYVLSQAEMEAAFLPAGNRAINLLNQLAPYGAGTPDVPVAQADYADTYTLDTAAKVDDVLNYLGPRGFSVFEYLISVKAA